MRVHTQTVDDTIDERIAPYVCTCHNACMTYVVIQYFGFAPKGRALSFSDAVHAMWREYAEKCVDEKRYESRVKRMCDAIRRDAMEKYHYGFPARSLRDGRRRAAAEVQDFLLIAGETVLIRDFGFNVTDRTRTKHSAQIGEFDRQVNELVDHMNRTFLIGARFDDHPAGTAAERIDYDEVLRYKLIGVGMTEDGVKQVMGGWGNYGQVDLRTGESVFCRRKAAAEKTRGNQAADTETAVSIADIDPLSRACSALSGRRLGAIHGKI